MLPSYMHSFAKDAGQSSEEPGKPPNAISAGALDKNYLACLPIATDGNNANYRVDATAEGWKLEPTLVFDVCENGTPAKFMLFGRRLDMGG
jgi:hypothetical protein